MARSISLDPPGVNDTTAMFEAVQKVFPPTLRKDKWYLTVVSALVTSGKPRIVGDLYSYLISQPEYSTPTQRQHLVRRIREVLARCCILSGVPMTMEATVAISSREREEDKDYGFVRENWQTGKENKTRAMNALNMLYKDDLPKILDKFSAHKDILFMIVEIEYGLALTVNKELDLLETELVVLPSVMCINLVGPTLWHLRCCMRVGITQEDVELIHQSIEIVAKFAGRELEQVGRVGDVKDVMHDKM